MPRLNTLSDFKVGQIWRDPELPDGFNTYMVIKIEHDELISEASSLIKELL
jgi:hypothetical protein